MGGDGRRDGELTAMDGVAQWRWTARRQLDGDEEGASVMAMSTRPAVGAIKANAALNYTM